MRFISIGGRCNVTYQIRKYSKNQETLFFDWLGIDMDSVIQLLQCKNIADILYYDNIMNKSQNLKPRIILKTLPKCVFIHDLSNNYNDHDVYTFLEKYKKRLNKIIELHRPKRKMRQNAVMIYIFYNYVLSNLLNVLLLFSFPKY
jgi:hypothetical protein